MTENEKKKDSLLTARTTPVPLEHRPISSKHIRKISPLGMRVLVQLQRDSNVTEGGLYLPEGAKEVMTESVLARVIEVASAIDHDTDQETNVSGIPLDAMVLINRKAGVKVPWDDTLRIVDTKDVLALVNEIGLT